jgi:hypothetical protein
MHPEPCIMSWAGALIVLKYLDRRVGAASFILPGRDNVLLLGHVETGAPYRYSRPLTGQALKFEAVNKAVKVFFSDLFFLLSGIRA